MYLLIIICIPVIILFFLLHYLKRSNKLSGSLKLLLGISFITLSLPVSFCAMTILLNEMAGKRISCGTGAVAIMPFGLLINLIGITVLLVLFKTRTSSLTKET